MPNSVMPDSVMLNSYLMLYHIPLYHFPLYLIPDCPLECYNRFLFSVIPDSIISDSVIPDSCFDIPDSVMPNSVIPDSSFACYNCFRYTRFPAPTHSTKAYDRRSNATCWRTSHHWLLFSEDPVPAEGAVPAVQRPQERVSTERGRGEHEQPVPVPQEVAVPEAPPRRRRHPRQGVHGHDSQDLQWVLHVSDRMGHGGASDGRQ